MSIKREIKNNLENKHEQSEEWDAERIEYEAEQELQALAEEGYEPAIEELSHRAF